MLEESTKVQIDNESSLSSGNRHRVKDIAPDYYDDYLFGDEEEVEEEEDDAIHEQWASSVLAYSSYWGGDPTSYSANNVIGPCRCFPNFGSNGLAWCPNNTNGPEYIELGYDHEISVHEVHIYESSHPGSVTKISARSSNSTDWTVIWQGSNTTGTATARDFAPDLTLKGFRANAIRIDMSMNGGWTEIDAVKIMGKSKSQPQEIPEISKFYRSLLKTGLYTDLTVVHKSSGREIKCLKAILSTRSSYLKTLIDSSENNTIVIDTFAPFPALVAAIDYMYSSFTNVRACHVIETFVLADQLMLPGLSDFCIRLFNKVVSQDNILLFYSAAKEHQSPIFLESTLDYMANKYKEVFRHPDLALVDKADLLRLCRSIANKTQK